MGSLRWAGHCGRWTEFVRNIAAIRRSVRSEPGLLGYAYVVPALLALFVAQGWRYSWVVRAWFVALTAWMVQWAGERGWLPVRVAAPRCVAECRRVRAGDRHGRGRVGLRGGHALLSSRLASARSVRHRGGPRSGGHSARAGVGRRSMGNAAPGVDVDVRIRRRGGRTGWTDAHRVDRSPRRDAAFGCDLRRGRQRRSLRRWRPRPRAHR